MQLCYCESALSAGEKGEKVRPGKVIRKETVNKGGSWGRDQVRERRLWIDLVLMHKKKEKKEKVVLFKY